MQAINAWFGPGGTVSQLSFHRVKLVICPPSYYATQGFLSRAEESLGTKDSLLLLSTVISMPSGSEQDCCYADI